jgi:3-dehydroquinate dehydratase / shikimate dehydrogenase
MTSRPAGPRHSPAPDDIAGPLADPLDTAVRSPVGSGRRAALVATLTAAPAPPGSGSAGPPAEVTGLEVRADLLGDVDPQVLRRNFRGTLCYTLRSAAAGGQHDGSLQSRHERLVRAAAWYDLVDLEADLDLTPDLLARIPAAQRRISWHGKPAPGGQVDVSRLAAAFGQVADVPARLYLLAPAVTTAAEAMAPLLLLARLGRADVTAFGTGPAGTWSRLLAPWLGAPVVYGWLAGPGPAGQQPAIPAPAGPQPAGAQARVRPGVRAGAARAARIQAVGAQAAGPDADGLPSIEQICTDYPLPALPPLRFVCGIAGRAAASSLSPRLHNAAYQALQLPGLYLPFLVEDLERFWPTVAGRLDELGVTMRGITVASPNKEAALRVADGSTPTVRLVGAANALVRLDGRGRADASEGAIRAIADAQVPIAGRKVAVIGCGGAGRALAHGLLAAGAEPTLVNRGAERGRFAADLLGLPFVPLADFDPVGYALVVNATPLRAESPVLVGDLDADAAVLDLAYGSAPTALVRAARDRRLTTVDGQQVLVAEVVEQFWLLTGRRMPALAQVSNPNAAAGPADRRT